MSDLIDLLEKDFQDITRKQITIDLVSGYLFDACDNPTKTSRDAIEYIASRIVNGHHYVGNYEFEKTIRDYHRTRTNLEKSAEKLVDMVDDCDKWLIG